MVLTNNTVFLQEPLNLAPQHQYCRNITLLQHKSGIRSFIQVLHPRGRLPPLHPLCNDEITRHVNVWGVS